MSINSYVAYGLGIRCELPLPELTRGNGSPDVRVRLGRIEDRPPFKDGADISSRVTSDAVCFCIRDVGAFLVRGVGEIVADPDPGVDERDLRYFILGPALAVVLQTRGLLVLHASAVAVNGAAVAFLGNAGWGKSTTAAALNERGHLLLSDDLLAVRVDANAAPLALPGFRQMKLWPDAVASLGAEPEGLPQVRPGVTKRARRLDSGYAQEPVPLRRVYVLSVGDRLQAEPIEPKQAFFELVAHSYGVEALKAIGVAPAHFRQCAELARVVPVRRLKRRRALDALPDIARLVEDELAWPAVAEAGLEEAYARARPALSAAG